jgi:hypothetical protein
MVRASINDKLYRKQGLLDVEDDHAEVYFIAQESLETRAKLAKLPPSELTELTGPITEIQPEVPAISQE